MRLPRRVAKVVLPRRVVDLIRTRRLLRRARRTMDRPEDLHEFWRQPEPEHNRPHTYIPHIQRSAALHQLIADLPKDARILEVGCNVGRNLAYLYDNGYPHVSGVEISPHAVALLRTTYPQLAGNQILVGAAEEVLPTLPTDGFDLVFTMAVLEHIHPDSSIVFDEIARIGRSILAIEQLGAYSHRQFPHDIPKIFRSRGLRLTSTRRMADL